MGVGGGRTTHFFAPEVKLYTAVDYSEGMIEHCKARFFERFPDAKFLVGDAKDLSTFDDHSFDFVLFSFNGIDYMPIPSRAEFLREVKQRLLAPGGYFCFSTHNLLSLKNLTVASVITFRLNIFAVLKKVLRRIKIRRLNAEQLAAARTADSVFIDDGTHDFGLQQNFIRTSFQIRMLREAGFTSIRGFSLRTGKELSEKDFCSAEDPWLYYLCN
jgi:SAM-dependent methyltransferase